MLSVKRSGQRASRLLVLGLVTSTLLVGAAAGQVKHNGRIERIGPFRVLRVWGDPKEMGFAHGYLVGEEFVATLPVLVQSLYGDNIAGYEQTVASLKDIVVLSGSNREEIEGIFEGIQRSRGESPEIELLHRRLRVEDLVFFNAMDMLRAFACSGFTVWGERAGEAGVVAGRNFDYPAFGPQMLDHQMIIVRQPDGRRKVASVTWPGYIGAFTGINDDGVGMFLHDGTGRRARQPEQRYEPTALMVKGLLETCQSGNVMRRARNALIPRKSPFSYMIRVVCSWQTAGGNPAAVFHIDADGAGFSPVKRDSCITTNHYLDDAFQPVGDAYEGSLRRYAILEEHLTGDVTSASAWKALDAVAASDPRSGTLHALVLYPEKRRVELAFASWKEQFVPATRNKPVTISFDELFGKAPAGGPGKD